MRTSFSEDRQIRDAYKNAYEVSSEHRITLQIRTLGLMVRNQCFTMSVIKTLKEDALQKMTQKITSICYPSHSIEGAISLQIMPKTCHLEGDILI